MKPRTSSIDDVEFKKEYPSDGWPVLFTNIEIRRMLKLVKATNDDIFFDLGCGWAQNLIIAAAEFGVKKCFGVERLKRRYFKAKERVKLRSLSNQVKLIHGQFEDVIDSKIKGINLGEATIVFYGLEADKKFFDTLASKLQNGCKLVYYYNTLFPSIKPSATDYPFYVSVVPFKKPISELDWLRTIIVKHNSTFRINKELSATELWEELRHDYKVMGLGANEIRKYKLWLTKVLRDNHR